MLIRLMEAVFAPKYPRHYRGRHRAPLRGPAIADPETTAPA
jgi:hypothetical protein